ncbi:hypothetical protein HU200_039202 [Digitaria exilis]|uniref:Uncharacterized protein n=1 Tax=Digitaria exilis TaxID=1010633 RepID=A0A835B9V4_9POAL|nr:hypothetical protein HU200_039202 [Digitaria exilis]
MAAHPAEFPVVPYCFILLIPCIVAVTTDRASTTGLLSHGTNQFSPSHSPGPLDFQNEHLYHAYLVIQRFKSTITKDPKNITSTWAGSDICGDTTYLGFYCATPLGQAEELTVTAVILNSYDLHAPKLQGFIDQLPDLALFHAASNNFGSGIPQLAALGYLYQLSVGSNLQPQYDVAEGQGVNNLGMGCITATINYKFNIGITTKKGFGIPHGTTDSKALLLNYNNLSGPLPANLGLSKLSYLAVANNKLTGPIPSSIEHLQDSLFELLLLNNQLSGCLPHELGMLHKATVIDAGMNQLTGPIPSSFSCLSSVEQLNLASNRLYGQVPDALCKLAGPAGRLANLTLSGNYFTSVGPACAALIKDGVMDVKNNCIPGLANQRRPAECAAFQSQQPKNTCPAANTPVTCPAAAAMGAVAPGERKAAREYSSYVTYATLHE